jgi:hypothetical protein
MKRLITATLVVALGLAGCAERVAVTPGRLATLSHVSVTHAAQVAPKADYHGPENAWGAAVGGVFGALLVRGALTIPERIPAYLAQERIDVGQIARDRFSKALDADPRFAGKVVEDGGDAHFDLKVSLYGLRQDGPGFSKDYRNSMAIEARLLDNSGAVLWAYYSLVITSNDALPLATFDEYFTNPDAFRNGLGAAADLASRKLLAKM